MCVYLFVVFRVLHTTYLAASVRVCIIMRLAEAEHAAARVFLLYVCALDGFGKIPVHLQSQ